MKLFSNQQGAMSFGAFAAMKWKYIFVLIAVLIAGGAIWKFYPTTPVTKIDQNDILSVSRGSIENRIDVVAKVALINKENLTFKQTGKIASVGVTEWASVKQWQVLASLDLKKVQLDLASQKISLDNAKIALSKLYESYGSTEKLRSSNTIQESERKIASLGLDLETLSREQTQTIVDQNRQIEEANESLGVMQQKIESLKLDVEYAKKTEGESIAETQATGDSRVRSTASNAQSLLNDLKDAGSFYKKLLFIENPNDSGFSQLGTSQLRSDATFQYTEFISNQRKIEVALSGFDTRIATTLQAQSLANTTAEVAKSAAVFNATIKDLMDATVVGSLYTDPVITAYRSTISSYLSKFTGAVSSTSGNLKDLVSGSSVSTIQLSAQSALASKQASLASAELDILKQKNALQALILGKTKYELDYLSKTQSKQLEIESAKSSLELNKKEYQDLLAGPKTTEIEQKKNDILQSQNTLASLQDTIRDYQLIAPMDGIVTLIGIRAGKTSVSTEGITVENRDMIQLKSLVDQSQVVKIKIWVPVKVSFDAYKQRSFDAKISFVESVPTETSGVVSYTVKFVMNKPEWIELYDSMTASARILIDTVADVVVIPLAAVQEDKEGKFVQLYEWGSLRRQAITTGKSDAINIEIKEWLKWGERVAIKAYTVTTATKSGFSLPGAGGWQRRSNNASAPTP